MLDVRKLRLLRELSRLGTIAAVAEALSYTPSAVSQQLSALEREAGVRLIMRCGRGVQLTAAGADLAERADSLLALLEQASAALAAASTELAGQLRIGAFQTAVRALLPAALVMLGAEHPGLELRVTEIDPADAPDALRTRSLDVALVHDYDSVPAVADPALETEPLHTETIFLASAQAFSGGQQDPARASDPVQGCSALPWITGTPGTLCHLVAVRLCEAKGFTPRIRHHADDFAAVLALVAAGQGVAIVPELALAETPAGPVRNPAGVVLTKLPVRRRTLIAYRVGAAGHPAVAACVSALRRSVSAAQPA